MNSAEPSVSTSNESTETLSWQSLYFSREGKEVVNKKTGLNENQIYSVCKLTKSPRDSTPCPARYIYNRNNGTGNLIRHLRNKHSIEVIPNKAIAEANLKVFLLVNPFILLSKPIFIFTILLFRN